jgi:hypothetical protein
VLRCLSGGEGSDEPRIGRKTLLLPFIARLLNSSSSSSRGDLHSTSLMLSREENLEEDTGWDLLT